MLFSYKRIWKPIIFLVLLNYAFSESSKYLQMSAEMEKPFKNYVEACRQGQLLQKRKMDKYDYPKITLVIPMHNEESNIFSVIRSIENQSFQELEIICINDNSNDKTLAVLKSLQKEDSRIRIFTNKKNRGILYNRMSGALKSTGQYVAFIDPADCFSNINILDKVFNLAIKDIRERIELVHYQTCGSEILKNGVMGPFQIFNTYNTNNFEQVIRQPIVGLNYMQKGKNITGSTFAFDKLYSKDLINRMADYIGPHIWNQNLEYNTDFLIAFASMKVTRSIVNTGEIGCYHLIDNSTDSIKDFEITGDRLKYPEKANKYLGDYLIILERMIELTDNEPLTEEFRASILSELDNNKYIPALARSVHYVKFLSLLEKCYKWKHNSNETKNQIRRLIKNVLSFKVDSEKKIAYLFK